MKTIEIRPALGNVLSVAFYPEAFGKLFGVPVERLLDQMLPAEDVVRGAFVDACNSLFEPECGDDPFRRLEESLVPCWQGSCSNTPAPLMSGWIRSLAMRAAFSKAGNGVRQIQRRIRAWTGQSYRELHLFSRVEEARIRSGEHRIGDSLDLAGLASSAGFARSVGLPASRPHASTN